MRIRDRLLALATASLAPSRAAPRGSAGGHERAHDRAQEETAIAAGSPSSGAAPPTPELPRQLGEQLLQSIHTSQQRLTQTAEALSVLAGAVVSAELALRQLLDAARGACPQPPANVGAGIMTLALHAANARALDGSYLFCGNADPPFSPEGAYLGSVANGLLVVLPTPPTLAISAVALTGLAPFAAAVDILPRLARAHAACGSTNPRVLETCYEPLAAATFHLQLLQTRVAAALAVLADATFVTEEAMPARSALPESEPEQHPSQLAQTFGALEAARSLAERTLAIFPSS